MRRLLIIGGAALTCLLLPLSAQAGTGFSPKAIAGKWTGTWENTTFGSKGSIAATVRAPKNGSMVVALDFGGTVFGCPDPKPETFTVTKGKGANRWSSTGFQIKGPSKAFGTVSLVYNHAKKTLKGGGGDPSCRPGLTWKLSASFAGKSFSGKVTIRLPDGTTASAELEARKK